MSAQAGPRGDGENQSTIEATIRNDRGRVVGLTLSILLVSVGLIAVFFERQQWQAPGAWPLWFSLTSMIAGFAASEIFVVHIRLRADAHTFSLVELPLALGLVFTSPLIMIASQMIGAGLVLLLYRRQDLVKSLFNLAMFAFTSIVAVIVLRSISPVLSPLDSGVLLAAASGLVGEALLSIALVIVVIRVASGSWRLGDLRSTVGFGIVNAIFASSLAIVAVVVIDSQPEFSWILLIPIAGTYLANWAYSSQRRRHEGLDFLYQSTKLLHQSSEFEAAFRDLLERTGETFNADATELMYLTESAAEPVSFRLRAGAHSQSDKLDDRHGALMALLVDPTARILGSGSGEPGRQFLRLSSYESAIIAPLLGESRVIGALVIANRISEVVKFDSNDARLAATLANHTATALENGRLEQSLAQLRVLEGRLTFQAFHDPLTGLANRTLFRINLARVIEERHSEASGAVLFIDLDDFKTINDSCGHAVGDALLIEVAARLKTCVANNDTVARFGGDEFAVLIPDVSEPVDADRIAEAILLTFEPAVMIDGLRLYIRASIGVAMLNADTDPVVMMRDADTAMYVAKAQGKNRVVHFESSMHQSSMHRLSLHADLVHGISSGELEPHFQPIVDLETDLVLGAEALARWNHPTLGVLTPETFLQVAEKTGLVATIDTMMLEQTCAWLARIELTDPGLVPWVNINLSPDSVRDPKIIDRIIDTLASYRLTTDRIGIEITENLMIESDDGTREILLRMSQVGLRLALDDFGTGYSSLGHLRTLPMDVIKIAKPFVDDIDLVGPSRSERAFTAAVVALVATLDRFIIAEGIERPEQASFLRSLGCHAGQGFHYRPPSTGDAFIRWARQHNEQAATTARPSLGSVLRLRHEPESARRAG